MTPRAEVWPHALSAEGRCWVDFAPGETLAELVARHCPGGADDWLAFVNGQAVPDDAWASRELEAEDVVQLRVILGDGGSDPLRTILQIGALVVGTIVGGPFGAFIAIGGQIAVNAILPPKLPGFDAGEQATPQYSLGAGANRARPWADMPVVLGTYRVFPDLVAQPYTEYRSGAAAGQETFPLLPDYPELDDYRGPTHRYQQFGDGDQFLLQLHDLGISLTDQRLIIEDTKLGTTLLSAYEGVRTQDGVDTITLVHPDVVTVAGGKLEAAKAVRRHLPDDTTRIGVDITSLNFHTGDDGLEGRSNGFRITVRPLVGGQPSGAGKAYLVSIRTPSGADAANPVRRSYYYEVEKGAYEVGVELTTPGGDTDRDQQQAVFEAARGYSDNTVDFKGRNPFALEIKASGQLSGQVQTLSMLLTQPVETWEGGAWKVGRSSNPGYVGRQWVKGKRIDGLLAAGLGEPDDNIEHEDWIAFAAHCELIGATCNMLTTNGAERMDVLAAIVACGGGTITKATGKYGVVWEEADEPVSAVFGPMNIVAGTLEVLWDHANLADEIVGQYVDAAADYKPAEVRRRVTGVVEVNNVLPVNLIGTTNGEEAAKRTNLAAAAQTYLFPRMKWEAPAAGMRVTKGQVVGLSHNLVGGSQGTRLKSIDESRTLVELYQPVSFSGDCWIWCLDLGATVLATSATLQEDGRMRLGKPLPLPAPKVEDDPLAYHCAFFNEHAQETKARVVDLEEGTDGNLRMELRPEVPQYYAARTADLSYPLLPRVGASTVTDIVVSDRLERVILIRVLPVVSGPWRGVVVSADGVVVGEITRFGESLEFVSPKPPGAEITISVAPGSAVAAIGPALSVTHTVGAYAEVDAEDGVGVEYIYASSVDGAPITGAANLPEASWNFRRPELAAGLVRGEETYYDKTPPDQGPDRPFRIRFRRATPGSPADNQDIGDGYAWEQEPAIKVIGLDGTAVSAPQEALWTTLDGANWTPSDTRQVLTVDFFNELFPGGDHRFVFYAERRGRQVTLRAGTILPADYEFLLEGDRTTVAVGTLRHRAGGASTTVTARLLDLSISAAVQAVDIEVADDSPEVDENSAGSVGVRLNRAPATDVTVTAVPPSVGLIILGPRRLTFTPNNWGVFQPVSYRTDQVSADTTRTITLQAAGGSDDLKRVYVLVRETPAMDVPQLEVNKSTFELDEGGSEDLLMRLDRRPSGYITVTYEISGRGVSIDTPNILFSPTQWELYNSAFTFTAAQDADSSDENVYVTFTARQAGEIVDVITVDIIIRDAEAATETVPRLEFDKATYEVVGGGKVQIGVRLASRPGGNVQVSLATPVSGAIDSVTPESRAYTQDNWNQYQYFTVTADDSPPPPGAVSPDRSAGVEFHAQLFMVGTGNQQTVAIGAADNVKESVGFVAWSDLRSHAIDTDLLDTAPSGFYAYLGLDSRSVLAFRTAQTSSTTPGNPGPDLNAAFEAGGSLTIRAGSVSYTFNVADALRADATEPYAWFLTDAQKAAGRAFFSAYAALSTSVRNGTTLTVSDADTRPMPGPPGDPQTAIVNVRASGDPTPAADVGIQLLTRTFTGNDDSEFQLNVRLTERPSSNVTVTASESSSAITLLSASPTLTFTPNNWNEYQQMTVRAIAGGTGTVTLTATGGATGTATATFTISGIIRFVTQGGIGTPQNPYTVDEGGSVDIVIRPASRPTSNIRAVVDIRDSEQDNYSPAERTWTPDQWETYRPFTYSPDQDHVSDFEEFRIEVPRIQGTGGTIDSFPIRIRVRNTDAVIRSEGGVTVPVPPASGVSYNGNMPGANASTIHSIDTLWVMAETSYPDGRTDREPPARIHIDLSWTDSNAHFGLEVLTLTFRNQRASLYSFSSNAGGRLTVERSEWPSGLSFITGYVRVIKMASNDGGVGSAAARGGAYKLTITAEGD